MSMYHHGAGDYNTAVSAAAKHFQTKLEEKIRKLELQDMAGDILQTTGAQA